MKYTRYDYRRKKDDRFAFFVIFLCIVLAAVLIGTGVSQVFIKNPSKSTNTPAPVKSSDNSKNKSASGFEVAVIQCGNFSEKVNVDNTVAKLKEFVNPFTAEENGKVKVYAGIYEQKDADTVIKKVKEKGLTYFKITYVIDNKDQTTQLISALLQGNLQILTQLTKNNVNAVKTDAFKSYSKGLKTDEKSSSNAAVLVDYKKYIDGMGKEIGKDKAEQNYIYIFNLIKKIGIKK